MKCKCQNGLTRRGPQHTQDLKWWEPVGPSFQHPGNRTGGGWGRGISSRRFFPESSPACPACSSANSLKVLQSGEGMSAESPRPENTRVRLASGLWVLDGQETPCAEELHVTGECRFPPLQVVVLPPVAPGSTTATPTDEHGPLWPGLREAGVAWCPYSAPQPWHCPAEVGAGQRRPWLPHTPGRLPFLLFHLALLSPCVLDSDPGADRGRRLQLSGPERCVLGQGTSPYLPQGDVPVLTVRRSG